MSTYYLYVKIHNVTGLRYLGQTKQDPLKYVGSGIDWLEHIKCYGSDLKTEIILESKSKSDIDNAGRYYSNFWKITTSADDFGNRIWANRINETGGGGIGGRGRLPGFSHSEETKEKLRQANKSFVMSEDRRRHLSEINTGKTHTVETKQKISNARKGKPRSAETKAKISESLKNRVPSSAAAPQKAGIGFNAKYGLLKLALSRRNYRTVVLNLM